jgi:hypothetical protein
LAPRLRDVLPSCFRWDMCRAPGPGQYSPSEASERRVRTGVGFTFAASNRTDARPRTADSFVDQARRMHSHSPGPGAYDARSSFGKQPSSGAKNKTLTESSYSFGNSDKIRQPCISPLRATFISKSHERVRCLSKCSGASLLTRLPCFLVHRRILGLTAQGQGRTRRHEAMDPMSGFASRQWRVSRFLLHLAGERAGARTSRHSQGQPSRTPA